PWISDLRGWRPYSSVGHVEREIRNALFASNPSQLKKVLGTIPTKELPVSVVVGTISPENGPLRLEILDAFPEHQPTLLRCLGSAWLWRPQSFPNELLTRISAFADQDRPEKLDLQDVLFFERLFADEPDEA